MVLFFTDALNTCRSSSRRSKSRCSRRSLRARIHVRIIVIAKISIVMTSLKSSRHRLETDIIGSSVTADSEDLDIFILGYDTHFLFKLIRSLHTRCRSRCILKCSMDVGITPCCVRILEGRHLKTSCRVTDDSLVLFIDRTHHRTAYDTGTATRTKSVSCMEAVLLGHFSFQIICHGFTPPLSLSIRPSHAVPCGCRRNPPYRSLLYQSTSQIRSLRP